MESVLESITASFCAICSKRSPAIRIYQFLEPACQVWRGIRHCCALQIPAGTNSLSVEVRPAGLLCRMKAAKPAIWLLLLAACGFTAAQQPVCTDLSVDCAFICSPADVCSIPGYVGDYLRQLFSVAMALSWQLICSHCAAAHLTCLMLHLSKLARCANAWLACLVSGCKCYHLSWRNPASAQLACLVPHLLELQDDLSRCKDLALQGSSHTCPRSDQLYHRHT